MKKLIALLILAILLAACGKEAVVTFEKQPVATENSTFEVKIRQGDKAVTDFKGNAVWQMKGMDHGTIETELTHDADGLYIGEVNLPMDGKWTVKIKGGSIDKTVELDVK